MPISIKYNEARGLFQLQDEPSGSFSINGTFILNGLTVTGEQLFSASLTAVDSYLVVGTTGSSPNARQISSSFGNLIIDNGSGSTVEINVNTSSIPALSSSNTFTGNNIFQNGLSGSLTQLATGESYLVGQGTVTVTSNSSGQIFISGTGDGGGGGSGGGADSKASYVVLNLTSSLDNERAIASGTGIDIIDGGAGGTLLIRIDDSTVPVLTASNTFSGPNIFSGGISGSHTHLDDGSSFMVAGPGITIISESNGSLTISGTATSGDPDASYILIGNTASLSNERALSSSFGNKIVDNGANGTVEVNVDESEIPVLSASNTFTGVNTFSEGLSGSLTKLADGTDYLVAGPGIVINSSSNGPIEISGSGGDGDAGASYIVIGLTSSLSNERSISSSFGTLIVDNGANNTLEININEAEIPVLSASNIFTGANTFSIISGTLMRNQAGDSYLVAGDLTLIDSSSGDQIIISVDRQLLSGNFADVGASYIVIGNTASLPNERALTSSFGNQVVDGGAGSTLDIKIDETLIPTLTASNSFTGVNTFDAGLSGSLTKLADGTDYLLAGPGITINSSSNGSIEISGSGGSGNGDAAASYVVIGLTASLLNERALASGFGNTLVDEGSNGDVKIDIDGSVIPVLSATNIFTGANTFSVISGTLMRNQAGDSYIVAGDLLLVDSSSGDQITISVDRQNLSGNFADPAAQYIVIGNTASLSGERALTSSLGILFVDAGADSTFDLRVNETEVPILSASNTFTGVNTFSEGLSGSLTKLADGTDFILAGPGIIINSSSNGPIEISGSGGDSDPDASYIVVGLTSSLSNERVLSSSFGNKLIDNGANGSIEINVDETLIPTLTASNTFSGNNVFTSGLSGTLFENQSGLELFVAGDLTLIDSSSTTQITISVDRQELSGNFADVGAEYIVIGNTASLPNERALTSSFGNQIIDNGAGSTVDIKIDETLIPTLTASNSFSGINTFSEGLSGSLTKLADGTDFLLAGPGIIINSSSNGPIEISGSGGDSDPDASYVVIGSTASLPNERVLTSSLGNLIIDGGAGSTVDIRINEIEVPILSASNTFTGQNTFSAGLSGSLTKLSDGTDYLIAGTNISLVTESNGSVTINGGGAGAGADLAAAYILIGSTGSLPNERALSSSFGNKLIDNGAGSTLEVNVDETLIPTLTASNTFSGNNTFTSGLSGTLFENEAGLELFVAGDLTLIDSSSTTQITISVDRQSLSGNFADVGASYVVIGNTASLSNERALVSGFGNDLVDEGADGDVKIDIDGSVIPVLTASNTFSGINVFSGEISGTLLHNESGNSLFVKGNGILIDSSSGDQIVISTDLENLSGSFADVEASYIVIGNTASLPNERALASGFGNTLIDEGADGDVKIDIDGSIIPVLTATQTFSGDNTFTAGLSGTLFENQSGLELFVAGDLTLIDSSSTTQITISVDRQSLSGNFADVGASYVVIGNTASLENERALASGFGNTLIDEGADGDVKIDIDGSVIPVLSATNIFTGANTFSVISGTLMRNQAGDSYLVAGDLALIDSSSGDQVIISIDRQELSGNFADVGASYVVLGNTASLPNERALTSSFGNQIIDNGAGSTLDIKIDETLIPTLTASNTFSGINVFSGEISGTLFENQNGLELFVAGDLTLIDSSSTTQITISVDRQSLSGNFADVGASYVVIGNTASLENERALVGGFGNTLIDEGADGDVKIDIDGSIIPILSATQTFAGINTFTNGLSGSLTQLADGSSFVLAGPGIIVNSSSNGGIEISGSAGDADPGASYIVVGLTSSLINERALSSSFGNKLIDNGANNTIEINVDETLIPTLTASNTFTGNTIFTSGLSGTLFENESGLELFVAGDLTLIDSSSTTQITISVDRQSLSGNFADVGASYVVIGNTASLPNERALASGFGNTLIDEGADGDVKIDIDGSVIPVLSSTQTFAGINTFTNGLSGSLTQLSDGTSFVVAGPGIIVNSSSNGQIEISGSAGDADPGASYIVVGLTSSLVNERALSSSFGNKLIDNGADGTIEVNIDETLIPTLTASNTFTGNTIFTTGLSGTLFENQSGLELFVAGDLTLIDSSSTTQITISVDRQSLSGNFADVGASYVVIGNTASLPNERALASGFGNTLVDEGADGDVKIDIDGSVIPVLSATNLFVGTNTFSDISGTLMRNQAGNSYLVKGNGILVNSSSGDQVILSTDLENLSGSFADVEASYVVIGNTSSLSNERAFVDGFGNNLVDEGADGDVKIDVDGSVIPVLSATQTFSGVNTFTNGLSGSLTKLADGTDYLLAGPGIIINSSSNGPIEITGSTAAGSGDPDASYIVIGLTASLSNERVLTSSFGNQVIDGGANGNVDIKIDETLIPTLTASNTFSGNTIFTSGLSGTLFENESGLELFVAGDLTLIDSSSTTQITISVDRQNLSGNFADPGASYVVIGNTASLSNERALVSGFGNNIVDEGADGDVKIDIDGSVIPVLSATNIFTGANTFSIISGTLMRNQAGDSYLVNGNGILVDSSSGDQVILSADLTYLNNNFSDAEASYIVIGNTASLPNERALTSSFGNQIIDGGAGSTLDIKIDETLIPTLTASNTFSGVNTFTGLTNFEANVIISSSFFEISGSDPQIIIRDNTATDHHGSWILQSIDDTLLLDVAGDGPGGDRDNVFTATRAPFGFPGDFNFNTDVKFIDGVSGSLFENEAGLELFVAGDLTLIDSSSWTQITISVDRQSLSGNFADVGASYVVLGNTASLSNERAFVGGFGNTLVDQGADGDVKIDIDGSIIPVLSASNTFTGANIFSIISGTLMRNQAGNSYLAQGNGILVNSSSGDQIVISSDLTYLNNNFSDAEASYIVIGNTSSLPNERSLSSSFGILVSDNGANSTVDVDVDTSEIPTLNTTNTFSDVNTFTAGLSGSLTKLSDGTDYLIGGQGITIASSTNGPITISTDAPDSNAQYIVVSLTSSLSQERALTAGYGITIFDNGANGNITVNTDGTLIPVLSASNIFTSDNTISGSLTLSDAAPKLLFNDTDSSLNERNWELSTSGNAFSLRANNDADTPILEAFRISRTGVASINSASFYVDTFEISGSDPEIILRDTQATADEGQWALQAISDEFRFDAINDDGDTRSRVFTVPRTAGVPDSFDFSTDVIISSSLLDISGANPQIIIRNDTATDDEGQWSFQASFDEFHFSAMTDDVDGIGVKTRIFTVPRTAGVPDFFQFSTTLDLNGNALESCSVIKLRDSTPGPLIQFHDTNSPVDAQKWNMFATSGVFVIDAKNDAEDTTLNAFQITRTGIASIDKVRMFATAAEIKSDNAELIIYDTSAAVSEGVWSLRSTSNELQLDALADNEVSRVRVFTVPRNTLVPTSFNIEIDTVISSSILEIFGSNPQIILRTNNTAADEGQWSFQVSVNEFHFSALNDIGTKSRVFTVGRTAGVPNFLQMNTDLNLNGNQIDKCSELEISGSDPIIFIKDNTAATDEGHWMFQAINNEFRLNTRQDTGETTIAMRITRTGGVADEFIFNNDTVISSSLLKIFATDPDILLEDSSGPTNERSWGLQAINSEFRFNVRTDAGSNSNVYTIKRTAGAADSFDLKTDLIISSSILDISGSDPQIIIRDNSATDDEGQWTLQSTADEFRFDAMTDDDDGIGVKSRVFTIPRTAGVPDSFDLSIDVDMGANNLDNVGTVELATGGPTWSKGSGTPEGAVTAVVGSIFSRTDGGAGTSFYVKETGSGNTGWVGK